jgi:hypothetical protein
MEAKPNLPLLHKGLGGRETVLPHTKGESLDSEASVVRPKWN